MKVGITCVHWLDKDWTLGPILVLHFKIWKVMGHHVLKERHAKLKVKLKRFVHASGTFTGQFSRELNQQLHNLLIQCTAIFNCLGPILAGHFI